MAIYSVVCHAVVIEFLISLICGSDRVGGFMICDAKFDEYLTLYKKYQQTHVYEICFINILLITDMFRSIL